MVTIDYSQYYNTSNEVKDCPNDCSGPCVRGEGCHTECDNTVQEYCYLCYDRECMNCENYETCIDDTCAPNSGYADTDSQCECDDKFGRIPGYNDDCKPCYTGCNSCDQGALTNFTDCLACEEAYIEI